MKRKTGAQILVRESLSLWARREFGELWEPVRFFKGQTAARAAEFVPEDEEALTARNRKRRTKHSRMGALSKGVCASSSLGLAPNSIATYSALRRLHRLKTSVVSSPLIGESGPTPVDEDLQRFDLEAVGRRL